MSTTSIKKQFRPGDRVVCCCGDGYLISKGDKGTVLGKSKSSPDILAVEWDNLTTGHDLISGTDYKLVRPCKDKAGHFITSDRVETAFRDSQDVSRETFVKLSTKKRYLTIDQEF